MREITKMAYSKGLNTSEGTFYGDIHSKVIRNMGVQSFFGLDDVKKSKNKDGSGIANVLGEKEMIYLSEEAETFSIKYTVKLNGIEEEPTHSDGVSNFEYFRNMIRELKKDKDILKYVAMGYVYNMVVGNVGFRNKDNSIDIRTKINVKSSIEEFNGEYVFEDQNYRLFTKNPFEDSLSKESNAKILYEKNQNFKKLVDLFALMLEKTSNDSDYTIFEVENVFKMQKGALLYPSENFTEGDLRSYYRTISSKEENFGLTDVKVGNALRTIDSFFDTKVEGVVAISVEPNGANLRIGEALRKKNDFYTLINKKLNDDGLFKEELSPEEKFFMLSVFLRGGLYQMNTKKKK